MFKVALVGLVGLISCIASAGGEVTSIIKKHCANEWGKDYSMVEYCVNNEIEAFNKIVDYNNLIKDSPLQLALRDKCAAKYDSFRMRNYCIEKEDKALQEVIEIHKSHKGTISFNILETCGNKWGDDYSMIMYCHEKNLKSYNKLNKIN